MARRFPEFTNTTLQGHLNPRGEKISNPLICTPDRLAVAQLRENWSWLVSTEFKPELFSIFGDVFTNMGRTKYSG